MTRAVGRWLDRLLTFVVLAGCVAATIALGGSLFGYRLLVIESGSMRPAIPVGALVISQRVHPLQARVGQVVSFSDEERGGELVTHRLVAEVRDGDVVHMATRGDANRVDEHWVVPVSGHIGRAVAVLPGGGRLLADMGTATGHLVMIWLVVAWAAVLAVRWVLRLDPGRDGRRRRHHPGQEAGRPGG